MQSLTTQLDRLKNHQSWLSRSIINLKYGSAEFEATVMELDSLSQIISNIETILSHEP